MLNQLHLLFTYACTKECDHCFVYSSPSAKGTFTLNQVRDILAEAVKIYSIDWIYFEGGEPFLYFPIMVEAMSLAKELGFKIGLVTNGYWITSQEDAEIYLNILKKIGIDDFCVSDDCYHNEGTNNQLGLLVKEIAQKLDISINIISLEEPKVINEPITSLKGKPIIGGNVRFIGRAVENLTYGLPKQPWENLRACIHEELEFPTRVHLDPFGNVHICQGLVIGNFLKTPLSDIINNYNPQVNGILKALIKGGPAALAKTFNAVHADSYVDECHFCFDVRRVLQRHFTDTLAPPQIYGIK